MKTETNIAKNNVKHIKTCGNCKEMKPHLCTYCETTCQTHLASCQRFLEYFNEHKFWYMSCVKCGGKPVHVNLDFMEKIKDIQNAIKIYRNAGLK